MSFIDDITAIIGQPESERLEYKAVLPPAATIARLLCSFANTEGGNLILGITEPHGTVQVMGLSDEFRAIPITQKAIALLSPTPIVHYDYVPYEGKRVFAIHVEKANIPITLAGREYIRQDTNSLPRHAEVTRPSRHPSLQAEANDLQRYRVSCTAAKAKVLDHYQSVLNLIDDLAALLYPVNANTPTTIPEGKILTRILFSSCADNFETYLSDLLLEIYLAKPETLKSKGTVTLEEVLNCVDMEDFINKEAAKRVGKLQRGSVNGFIEKNPAIGGLQVFTEVRQKGVEDILQIRHLYAHRNGIVDEKFREHFTNAPLNTEYELSLDDFLQHFAYLAKAIEDVDRAAINMFQLAMTP